MYKLIIIAFLFSLLFTSCNESGHIHVPLDKSEISVSIVPESSLTSSCRLSITGKIDCGVEIKIPAEKSIHLSPGKVHFKRKYEWYESGKVIRIVSDSCKPSSYLDFDYTFYSGYFGAKDTL